MTVQTGSTEHRFHSGTFTPGAGANSMPRIVRALAGLELKLFLRNGEQLMLNMLIPIVSLIVLCLVPLGSLATPRANSVVPGVLALAVLSSAFTGQAIAVGFDRRYGALKRLGATIAPPWAVIAGKSAAVTIVVAVQAALLGTVGLFLGWRPTSAGLLMTVPLLAASTAVFAAKGLLLGGSLRAEVVLPLANILWFVQCGLCGVVLFPATRGSTWRAVAELSPSGALATALREASSGYLAITPIMVLACWGTAAAALARRSFSFT